MRVLKVGRRRALLPNLQTWVCHLIWPLDKKGPRGFLKKIRQKLKGEREAFFCTFLGKFMKQKTHSGAKKRFKALSKGKIKRKQAGLRHLLSPHSSKNKRHLGKTQYVHKANSKAVKAQLVV